MTGECDPYRIRIQLLCIRIRIEVHPDPKPWIQYLALFIKVRKSSTYRYEKLNLRLKTRDAPDTVFAGYPANPKAGYRISG
jgi:hypothetical protein